MFSSKNFCKRVSTACLGQSLGQKFWMVALYNIWIFSNLIWIWIKNLVINALNPGKSSGRFANVLSLHCFIWKLRKFAKLVTSAQEGNWTQQWSKIVLRHFSMFSFLHSVFWISYREKLSLFSRNKHSKVPDFKSKRIKIC